MITLLIANIVYSLILTLFVVKLHNVVSAYTNIKNSREIPHTSYSKNSVSEDVQPSVQEETTFLKQESSLDDLSKALEAQLNKETKSDLEKWLEIDKTRSEQQRLNKLNDNYGKEY